MLDRALGPDAIASHEAGHDVVGVHFGLQVEGVDLVPTGKYAAVTRFGAGELQRLNGEDLAVIAYSGIGGQQVAVVHWSTEDSNDDFRKFGAGAKPDCLDRAKTILRADAPLFQRVAARLRDTLDKEPRFVPVEELIQP
ncbi:hypothetical protein EV644_11929 [Kribbella orskensis]|uniref:Peptidase M41-like protein n=1 Tax=Kribbella orskensis TaxID=2512216 RepID=A0ABY2BDD1_9ACTN|nr:MULTISPECIES: hypothetical protein [Kribbella]TCN34651.1 hypothetical protein EV642_120113 [Kribbella sp. VKM Ac-2500]TCO14917.1 hypothetical protein EV644_11929 [Kribbella orskensis]